MQALQTIADAYDVPVSSLNLDMDDVLYEAARLYVKQIRDVVDRWKDLTNQQRTAILKSRHWIDQFIVYLATAQRH